MTPAERPTVGRGGCAGQTPALLFGLFLLLVHPLAAAGDVLRVAVISDLNSSYGATEYEPAVDAAVARIIELKPDLVISTGDMVAGQRKPHLPRPQVVRMWAAFHAQVSDRLAAAGIPLAVTPGNHDGSAYHGFERERTIYAEQWTPRKPRLRFVDDAGYPFHYAFEAGDVLFISLDATTVGHLPPGQLAWLGRVLAEQGPDYRRRVVFSHVPLWPFAHGRESEFIGDPALQAVLETAGVDLYLSGHHHAFYPGSKDGIGFVGQSCLGAGPRRLIGTTSRSPQGFTVVEFGGEAIGVAAYEGPGFGTTTDWATLPARIRTGHAELLRADLVQGVITPLGPVTVP